MPNARGQEHLDVCFRVSFPVEWSCESFDLQVLFLGGQTPATFNIREEAGRNHAVPISSSGVRPLNGLDDPEAVLLSESD